MGEYEKNSRDKHKHFFAKLHASSKISNERYSKDVEGMRVLIQDKELEKKALREKHKELVHKLNNASIRSSSGKIQNDNNCNENVTMTMKIIVKMKHQQEE